MSLRFLRRTSQKPLLKLNGFSRKMIFLKIYWPAMENLYRLQRCSLPRKKSTYMLSLSKVAARLFQLKNTVNLDWPAMWSSSLVPITTQLLKAFSRIQILGNLTANAIGQIILISSISNVQNATIGFMLNVFNQKLLMAFSYVVHASTGPATNGQEEWWTEMTEIQ